MRIESFGISDTGLVRRNNEDVWKSVVEKDFYIIADGMGGHNAGEIASQIATESMCHSISTLVKESSPQDSAQLLQEAINHANQRVFDKANTISAYRGMGTTLCCFLLQGNSLIYAHVGDSRLYKFSKSSLEQLTTDHSSERPFAYKESENAPAVIKMRPVITRAIGTHLRVEPDIDILPILPGEIYLLCSDGLSDLLCESEIENILETPLSLDKKGEALVRAALKRGGTDNITLLLVRVFE